jgi:hypothetical protein
MNKAFCGRSGALETEPKRIDKGIGNRTPNGTVSAESPQLMAKAGHWETEKTAAEMLEAGVRRPTKMPESF